MTDCHNIATLEARLCPRPPIPEIEDAARLLGAANIEDQPIRRNDACQDDRLLGIRPSLRHMARLCSLANWLGGVVGETRRVTVNLSRQTEGAVRSFLAERGRTKSLSAFVEQAVNNELLRATIREIQEKNAHLPAENVQGMIDAACAESRAEFWNDRVWWSE